MSSATPEPLNLDNIQGDIVLGLPKKRETFYFFRINDNSAKKIREFQARLREIIPLITTTSNVEEHHRKISAEKSRAQRATPPEKPQLLDIGGLNIAFSNLGVKVLQLPDLSKDTVFEAGMNNDKERKILGDGPWAPEFTSEIHGVLLVTGHTDEKVVSILDNVLAKLGDTIIEVPDTRASGKVRPEAVESHEHFGYADGISQPLVSGFPGTPHTGKDIVDQGIIITGRKDDPIDDRADWAIDGSFLCFRKLRQLVPEFNDYLETNRLKTDDQTPPDPAIGRLSAGAELLGARLVGRWKSGAPVEVTPNQDDIKIASDPHLNDDFRYNQTKGVAGQAKCPYAAHTRKTNPRDDLKDSGTTERRRIMRHGIQYGPEVTEDENKNKKSSDLRELERGLLFVCYQSDITSGFQFIQKMWANTPGFIFLKDSDPGLDPLIGVNQEEGPKGKRFFNDLNIPDKAKELPQIWVVPQGGEYFFSPSISSLKTFFSGVGNGESIGVQNGTRQGL